ncbi:hypothetical protein QFZ35_000160 [Arthrobacter ulcerisalmonis]|nr:hypothetical protein [Arthrobacter ulcerisalmonis]
MLPRMPYLMEYVTNGSIGRSIIYSASFGDALIKAKNAQRGLQCNSAVLCHTPESDPIFGKGSILASYTPADGWRISEVWPR